MTRIFLIRHAESEWNKVGKIQGHSDTDLSEKGRAHTESLARWLKRESIEVIYTSYLKRAKETARILNDEFKVPVVEEEKLAEIGFGSWEGKTHSEINSLHNDACKRWLEDPSKVFIPGAEELSKFRQRAGEVFEAIVKRDNGKSVAIITHAGVIRSIIASVLKADFATIVLALALTNTGVTLIEYAEEPGTGCLIYLNNTSHLPDE